MLNVLLHGTAEIHFHTFLTMSSRHRWVSTAHCHCITPAPTQKEAGDNPQSQSGNKVEEKNACHLDHNQSQLWLTLQFTLVPDINSKHVQLLTNYITIFSYAANISENASKRYIPLHKTEWCNGLWSNYHNENKREIFELSWGSEICYFYEFQKWMW